MESMPSNPLGIAPARSAPLTKIRRVEPERLADASSCEVIVQIGIFFDGTGNNRDADLPKLAHSNIARLFDAYLAALTQSTYKFYIPGLGTPFPQIDENTYTLFGKAFATGGEGRILYVLLQVINTINFCAFNSELLNPDQVKALCKNSRRSKKEDQMLADLGMADGLLGNEMWRSFVEGLGDDIEQKLKHRGKPKILECIFDVFGFSRGATEARVFCHWLEQVMRNRKIAGIPCRIRFLGLMDTVASVGIQEGVGNFVRGTSGGHGDWARPESMRISPLVANCVHMVAMHEQRLNFPLDRLLTGDVLPANCQEFVYPGVHSDVGGGYGPGDLGVAIAKDRDLGDSLKLSQIPLNHMFECAAAAGVPLSKERAASNHCKAPFTVNAVLQQAFERFFDISKEAPRLLGDWAFPYLVWRWQIRQRFADTTQVRNAVGDQRTYLLASNAQFCTNGKEIRTRGARKLARSIEFLSRAQSDDSFDLADHLYFQEDLAWLEPEAAALHAKVNSAQPVPAELASFFEDFVHDSLAGFRESLVEIPNYWHYRRVFRGSLKPLLR